MLHCTILYYIILYYVYICMYTLYDNSVNISGRPTGCMMAKSPSVQRKDPIRVKLLVVGMTSLW